MSLKKDQANTMIKYISIFCLCLYSCVSYASSSLKVKQENISTVKIKKDQHITKIELGEINGYKTNCNESYLVVWGIPKKLMIALRKIMKLFFII